MLAYTKIDQNKLQSGGSFLDHKGSKLFRCLICIVFGFYYYIAANTPNAPT
jgi:hypothetical protein